jgi:hypothetical protein
LRDGQRFTRLADTGWTYDADEAAAFDQIRDCIDLGRSSEQRRTVCGQVT